MKVEDTIELKEVRENYQLQSTLKKTLMGKTEYSQFSERWESGRDKEYGYGAHGRRTKRRWDEAETDVKYDNYVENFDAGSGKSSDWKPDSASAIKKSDTPEIKSNGIRSLSPDSINNSIKSRGEARKVDLERSDGGKYEGFRERC